jgi:hypothetical protein
MISRYDNRGILENKSEKYKSLFKNRNVKFINQYSYPSFKDVNFGELLQLSIQNHVWALGDRFYKLADKYYGKPEMWWVIAHFNKAPTESHLKTGDVVDIPMPLEKVLEFLDI